MKAHKDPDLELLTLPQAARRVGVSDRLLRDAIESGALPVFHLSPGGWPRVRASDLRAWIEAARRSVAAH